MTQVAAQKEEPLLLAWQPGWLLKRAAVCVRVPL